MDRVVSVTLASTLPLLYATFTRSLPLAIPLCLFAIARITSVVRPPQYAEVDFDELREKAERGAILAVVFYQVSPWLALPVCVAALLRAPPVLPQTPHYVVLFACDSPLDLALALAMAVAATYEPGETSRGRVRALMCTCLEDAMFVFLLATHRTAPLPRGALLVLTVAACALAWKDRLPKPSHSAAESVYKSL